MTDALIRTSGLTVRSCKSRVLFQGLNLVLERERVALVGRNGVGKSTLLSVLAGKRRPDSGTLTLGSTVHLVEQAQDVASQGPLVLESLRYSRKDVDSLGLCWEELMSRSEFLSHGELRKLRLLAGQISGAEMLLLDEPTQDLDGDGVAWFKSWLSFWEGGLLVATHDRSLLETFEHFFVMAEAGCHYFEGTVSQLHTYLDEEHRLSEERYLRRLNRLAEKEEKTLHIARRRGRKKRFGRVSELDRATPRSTLNQKRDYAQVKHGRMKRDREAKLGAFREWAKSARRGLRVELPLVVPKLDHSLTPDGPIVEFRNVGMVGLFGGQNFTLCSERLGIVGPNGSGKTTLLDLILRERQADIGVVRSDLLRIGSIAQAGENWRLKESLLERLSHQCGVVDSRQLLGRLMLVKFPMSLAERPLYTLSPGERVRAALICLFYRAPRVQMLVLDEPTYGLDLLGQAALADALNAWNGGLVVVSHDRAFLSDIRVERFLELGGENLGVIGSNVEFSES